MYPTNTKDSPPIPLDALIVGAGFAGCYQLHHLRAENFNVKLLEAGSDYGGVWHFNRYPRARVDSAVPLYEFSDPEIWSGWTWSQRFPGSEELRAYFRFVAEKWDLRRDTVFDSSVNSAEWIEEEKEWIVKTKQGETYIAKFLLSNIGFAAKKFTPEWEGIETFPKDKFIHSAFWPHEEPDLKGKRIALIGTGATGVQIAQEISKTASKLIIFQRTPNMAMPMGQKSFLQGDRQFAESSYPTILADRKKSFGGFDFNFSPLKTFLHTPEERNTFYEDLWAKGDFHFWLGTYHDMLFDKAANEEAYGFWRNKTRPKIENERTREMLAPMEQLYAFGTKRVPLENGYFELFNQTNVRLVDVNSTPIQKITAKGIQTSEKEWEVDYIIAATGFDNITGGFDQIFIRGVGGQSLKEKWKGGLKTYLGMAVNAFPNMFFTYGPQAPTAFCNGPVCAEEQGEWIVQLLKDMREKRRQRVEVEAASEEVWAKTVKDLAEMSLLTGTKSWYMGDNIPNKKREILVYIGAVPKYLETLEEVRESGYQGFEMV